jgi:hypothetical protein
LKIGSLNFSFANLKSLIGIDLSGNQLIGPVPQELGTIASLNVLDLNNNDFSGIFYYYYCSFYHKLLYNISTVIYRRDP